MRVAKGEQVTLTLPELFDRKMGKKHGERTGNLDRINRIGRMEASRNVTDRASVMFEQRRGLDGPRESREIRGCGGREGFTTERTEITEGC